MEDYAETVSSPLEHQLSDIYRWIRPYLTAGERRAVRSACSPLRTAHDSEEPALNVPSQIKGAAEGAVSALTLAETTHAVAAVIAHGCQPSHLRLRLAATDPDAEARGVATLQCIASSRHGTSPLASPTGPSASASLTTISAWHLPLTMAATEVLAAAAPCLSTLFLADSPKLSALPSLLANSPLKNTLRSLHLEHCHGWPCDAAALAAALAGCKLEHLSWLLTNPAAAEMIAAAVAFDDCSTGQGLGEPADAEAQEATVAAEKEAKCVRQRQQLQQLVMVAQHQYILGMACATATLPKLTQLRSLTLDLRLPSYDIGPDTAARDQVAAAGGAAAGHLASGLTSLTRLTRLELDEGGSAPHPAWRLQLLAVVAALPQLAELSWRRLEVDSEAAAALVASTSLTSLFVERLLAPAGVKAVVLAATAAAVTAKTDAVSLEAAGSAGPASSGGGHGVTGTGAVAARGGAPAAAALQSAMASAVVAANAAAAIAFPDAAQEAAMAVAAAAISGAPLLPPLWRRLLLPLPPQLRQLRLSYSGLGGMSLSALAALQLPAGGLELFELRNPKLEIGDGDVEAPAGTCLLPQAALALGLGVRKLAEACPQLGTLRIINEARQREALSAPDGWEDQGQQPQPQLQPQGGMGGAGGGGGPGAGGGHAPWLAALSGLKMLRRLTLSGLKLGSTDAEVLKASCPALEELHLVPLSSVSSAAVPVLRGMQLRRLTLPHERH